MLPWWWSPQRMMSNSVSESEKEILTGCVSFYTQWFDVCVCIRVRGLHLVSSLGYGTRRYGVPGMVQGLFGQVEQLLKGFRFMLEVCE